MPSPSASRYFERVNAPFQHHPGGRGGNPGLAPYPPWMAAVLRSSSTAKLPGADLAWRPFDIYAGRDRSALVEVRLAPPPRAFAVALPYRCTWSPSFGSRSSSRQHPSPPPRSSNTSAAAGGGAAPPGARSTRPLLPGRVRLQRRPAFGDARDRERVRWRISAVSSGGHGAARQRLGSLGIVLGERSGSPGRGDRRSARDDRRPRRLRSATALAADKPPGLGI